MIIYEINLTIENEIFDDYYNWLIEHVKQMLQFDGFNSCEIAKDNFIGEPQYTKMIVRYMLDSEENLNHYLTNFASKMREEGIHRFGNQFTATRRVLVNVVKFRNNTN